MKCNDCGSGVDEFGSCVRFCGGGLVMPDLPLPKYEYDDLYEDHWDDDSWTDLWDEHDAIMNEYVYSSDYYRDIETYFSCDEPHLDDESPQVMKLVSEARWFRFCHESYVHNTRRRAAKVRADLKKQAHKIDRRAGKLYCQELMAG